MTDSERKDVLRVHEEDLDDMIGRKGSWVMPVILAALLAFSIYAYHMAVR